MWWSGHRKSSQGSIFFFTEGMLIFASFYLTWAALYSMGQHLVGEYGLIFPKALLATAVCQLCLYYQDLYGNVPVRLGKGWVIKILQAVGLASIILAAFFSFYPSSRPEHKVFWISLSILPVLLMIWRHFYSRCYNCLFRKKVLIIGTDGLAKSVGSELVYRPGLGYDVVGFLDQDPAKIGMRVVNPGVIGSYKDLPEVVNKYGIDQVVIATDDLQPLPLESLMSSKLQGVGVEDSMSFYERVSGKIAVEQLKPDWLIFGQGFQISRITLALKRLIDLALAVVGLLIASPVFLFLSVAIKLTSPGPVFYKQERVGRGGRVFTLLKFRSMKVDAEKMTGPVWAQENDPRVTALGHIMRKFRLDELPQMINVLKGEMAFVGPRPERPEFVEELRKQIPYYNLRLILEPGITGWAQVRYHYGGTFEGMLEKLQYDLYYIKNISLSLDFIILLDTVKVVLFRKGSR
jgi:sugar transferase (PEP-CTERM system associated)